MQSLYRFKTSIYLPSLVFSLLFLFSIQNIYAQQSSPLQGRLPAGRYRVGYKILDEKDFSRSFLKQSGAKFIPAPREIKVSLWYPAQSLKAARPKMKFEEYVFAMDGATSEAAKIESRKRFTNAPIVQELPKAAIANLLRMQTAAMRDAPFIKGENFPVIVLGQGLYYESPLTHTILCEFLAGQGFIVATTQLVGAHSPLVKLDVVDLEADVRDMEFVAGRARTLENADKEKLAVVGFDMGGLAGLILTMRNPDVDAYASLDSGILATHNLRLVKAMPDYDPLRLRVPLFHATHPVEELARFNVTEDAVFMDAARYSNRLILRFSDARHADFTSRPMIESIAAEMQDERTAHRRRSFEIVAQNLLAFLKAHLQNDSKSLEAIYNQVSGKSYSTVKFTKERKPTANRTPISEDEFLNYLSADGAEKAAILFRKMQTEFPDEQIFREEVLNQAGYNRLYRGESVEAIRILKLNVEAFPNSANAYDSLAQAYASTGESEQAKVNYRKSLEIDPNNENTKAQLKRLEEKK